MVQQNITRQPLWPIVPDPLRESGQRLTKSYLVLVRGSIEEIILLYSTWFEIPLRRPNARFKFSLDSSMISAHGWPKLFDLGTCLIYDSTCVINGPYLGIRIPFHQ